MENNKMLQMQKMYFLYKEWDQLAVHCNHGVQAKDGVY